MVKFQKEILGKKYSNLLAHVKAQAATEFLMTYGWAILVVLVAIAALAYFGVLSPNKFLPESCIIGPGFSCDHKITQTESTLVLTNGIGKDITINSLKVVDCEKDSIGTDLLAGDKGTFTLTGCSNGNKGDRFKGSVTAFYTEKESGLNKTVVGTISSQVGQ